MMVALARRMQSQNYELEFVVQGDTYECVIYIVGTDPAVETYEQLINDVLQTASGSAGHD